VLFRSGQSTTIVLGAEVRAPVEGTWTATNPLQGLDSGLMFTVKLTNKTNDAIGVFSALLFASNIEAFLVHTFGANGEDGTSGSSDDRVVFITNDDDELVAASIPNLATVQNENGVAVAILVKNCTNKLVRDAGVVVGLVPDSYHNDQTLVIARGLYIQQPAVFRTGLEFHVVSARVANPMIDYPTELSISLKVFVGISAAISSGIFALGFAIVQYRHKVRLWRYAQPSWLLTILASNILGLLYACVLMTTPTNSKCEALLWLRTFALTSITASLVAKINVMTIAAVTHDTFLTKPARRMVGGLVAVLVVQAILVALQNHVTHSGDLVKTAYGELSSNLAQRKSCRFHNPAIEAVSHVLVMLLSVYGVYRAWVARNVAPMCDESRGLLVATAEAFVLSMAVILIRWTTKPQSSTQSLLWLEGGLVLWYVFSMLLFVFLPRLHRQFTVGDMTVTEMREMIKMKNVQQLQHRHKQPPPRPPRFCVNSTMSANNHLLGTPCERRSERGYSHSMPTP